MKVKEVPFSWIPRWGYRLDVEPFIGGAVETRVFLEQAPYPKQSLRELTTGHNGGIYNGPMFRRNYVESREHGVPFLTSGSMLRADLTDVGFLRRKDAESPKLNYLSLRRGTTLISCSGSIGRTVYTRPDMEGVWASQDIMKVVPDPKEIPSGYLYAFLSSKFGVPMVASGTYGAIIQHIEPEHIRDLPVPRLGAAIEGKAHELIEEAANLRADAARALRQSISALHQVAGLRDLAETGSPYPFSVTAITESELGGRFDAFFHSRYHRDAVASLRLSSAGAVRVESLSVSVVEPTRFKRNKVDDERYGVPFFGTSALFWTEPVPSYMLPRSQVGIEDYVVTPSTILVPRSGQLSGILGRAVLPYGAVVGGAVTEDAIRINCADEGTAGFLFVALSSPYGVRQLKARAYGSSIPHLDVNGIRAVLVPDVVPDARLKIGREGARTALLRGKAIDLEREAVALVESAIEEAA